jgi:polyketide biosynthesis 3-hydroxy-3-methylglutaryl-CoA synthase-like enzyme PksG
MLSAIMHGPPSARSMGVFSYGGGCASEFFPCALGPAGPQAVAAAGIGRALDDRTILSLPAYDAIVDGVADAGFGVRDVVPDLCRHGEVLDQATATRPLALLSAIKGFHREYTWMKEGKPWTPEAVG